MILRVATVGVLAVALLNWPGSEAENENHPPETTGATDRAPVVLPNTSTVEINRALADRIVADFDLLVDGATWSPFMTHPTFKGFMLTEVSTHSLLDAFGFRDGDFLLWSPDDVFDFTGDEVVFRVRRALRERRIVIRITDS